MYALVTGKKTLPVKGMQFAGGDGAGSVTIMRGESGVIFAADKSHLGWSCYKHFLKVEKISDEKIILEPEPDPDPEPEPDPDPEPDPEPEPEPEAEPEQKSKKKRSRK